MFLAFLSIASATQCLLVGQTREMRFQRIGLDRGLVEYRTFDIAQDSVGFLWFATSEGLYRYDGFSYRIYRPLLNDTSGISSNSTWCLLTDRTGKLWIGTFDGGLDCFDPQTESFTHYRNNPSDPWSISAGPITALFEDHLGILWIGTETSGLNSFDRANKRFSHYRNEPNDPHSLSHDRVRAICEDPRGTIWVGTDDGLCAFDRTTGNFARYKNNPRESGSLSESRISSLWCDQTGVLWIGTRSKGLNSYDPRLGRYSVYRKSLVDPQTISSDSISAMYGPDTRFLWIGTLNGLNKFDRQTGLCSRHYNDPLTPHSLSGDYVRKIKGDRTGTIWIATNSNGINKVVRKTEQFISYRLRSEDGGDLPILALYHEPFSRSIWIGCDGLRQFDRNTGKTIIYRDDPGNPHGLRGGYVSSIRVDRSHAMWIGTWGGGLNRFDRSKNKWENYAWNPPTSQMGNNVVCIALDEQLSGPARAGSATVWMGAFSDGLLRFFPETKRFIHYKHDPANPRSLSNDRVLTTLVDRKGTLWIGTDGGGLDRFDAETGTFVHFKHDNSNPGTLRSNRIYAICDDPVSSDSGRQRVWVGTATGLDRFDVATGEVEHMTLEDSLSAVGIYGLIPDSRGTLWVSTVDKGMYRLSPETGRWKNYTAEDGLQSNVFNLSSYCSAPTGDLLFGGRRGFSIFHPDSIKENSLPPQVILASFSVFEKPFPLGRPLWTQPLIHLHYDQDFFSFQFLALDYTEPAKNLYAYKLEGYDKSWNYPGTRNFAGYTKVDPGEYVFRVKGSNSDGVWNDLGTSARVIIDPPFWRTWWFRSLMAALLVGIIAAAYNYRVSKLLEMERMRLRIASDLHDDIGSSLSGIALVTDSIRKRLPLTEQDGKQLADVTHAARHTADSLRDIVWIINPEHDKLDDILLRLKDAAAKILVGIDYTVDCKEDSLSSKLDMEFRRHVILIYKEILNNIVKHSRATSVKISIGEGQGIFSLSIADNGIGFEENLIKRGNGLNNLRRRAEQVKGTIQIESSPGRGTRVEFQAKIS